MASPLDWLRDKARTWFNYYGGHEPSALAPGVHGKESEVQKKSYSLLPMDQGRTPLRGIGPHPGDRVLAGAYNENPWLNIKLYRVATSIAMMGLQVGTEQADGTFKALPKEYPLWAMLRKPNVYLTGFDFRLLTMLYARIVGEVYWRVVQGGLAPAGLYVYPREWVRPIYARNSNTITEYEIRAQLIGGGRVVTEKVPAKDMVWLRHPDPVDPYIKGVGEVLAVATELDTFELASESDRRFFENDAQPPGAIVVPGTPTKDERKRILDDWQDKTGGPERQGSPVILSGGLDYKQFRQTRKEMDFVEGQKYLRDVIIRGVHKVILGLTDEVSFAAAKAGEAVFGRWELLPEVRWLEENINLYLAPKFDQRAMVKFENPVPADETFELQKANEGLTRGAITRAEWRRTMGFPQMDEEKGEVFLIPIAVLEVPVDSPPREEPPKANPNPEPEDNDDKPKPPGDQGARSTKPVGPYDTFAECVAANQDKDDPEAFCGYLENQSVEDIKALEQAGVLGKKNRRVKQLSERDIREILAEVEDDDMIQRLLGAYEAAVWGRYEDAVAEVGATPALDQSAALTARYMSEEAAQRVADINAETRGTLREVLAESVKAGEGLRQMADRVSDAYDGFKGDRAVLIARTETIDASRWTALETYKVAGVDGKEWLLAPDYDPAEDRGICGEYADKIVSILEDFEGPEGSLEGPTAHPGCRCAVAPVFAEEEGEEKGWRLAYATIERKQARITALGREHMRIERIFTNVLRRAFQEQQNRVLRVLRSR